MEKNAFVTGASGFLGVNLVEKLCDQGWNVTAMHRESSNLTYLNQFDVKKVVGRTDDLESLGNAMPENIDVIFHVAANTSAWSRLNKQQYLDNVVGTRNMIKCALAKNAKRFIHTSSIAAFGFHKGRINETATSTASSSRINYFVTKYQAEMEVKEALQKGLDAVIINPANILGPYDTRNWIQLFKAVKQRNIPGIPPAKGMFCFVGDVAQAHISAAEFGKTGENYLVGGVEASYERVTHQIQSLLGHKLKRGTNAAWTLKLATSYYIFKSLFDNVEPLLTPEKTAMLTKDMLCDDSKARETLNFRSISLEDMIDKTYQWFVSQGII